MMMHFYRARKSDRGFTLIELMIVVAIIGILAAIAVPNFLQYRNKSRVATAVSTMEGVRAAYSNYAADSTGNKYPLPAYGTYAAHLALNSHGATLPTNSADVSISSMVSSVAADGSDYSIVVIVDVPDGTNGKTLVVSPTGIQKQ